MMAASEEPASLPLAGDSGDASAAAVAAPVNDSAAATAILSLASTSAALSAASDASLPPAPLAPSRGSVLEASLSEVTTLTAAFKLLAYPLYVPSACWVAASGSELTLPFAVVALFFAWGLVTPILPQYARA
jgi:hypothetical protein